MSSADLVRMANQIAANFRHLGAEEAAGLTAGHIRSFWAPPMRADLLQVARSGEAQLDEIVVAALRILDPGAEIPDVRTPAPADLGAAGR
ncbi:MAG TPA: formate dehydrogenase subunit delta [Acidimicrobiales bacterium]|nr:formate dehydrogenase subunit delta [Acidimicrobiales bacterium]